MNVNLRPITRADIDALFAMHNNEEALLRAGVGLCGASRDEFEARMLKQEGAGMRTAFLCAIWADGKLVGDMGSFIRDGKREVCFWLDRSVWDKGVATTALKKFLPMVRDLYPRASIYARVVDGNGASSKVLVKCGFTEVGRDRFFSDVHNKDVEETLYQLQK